ncbi:MULTISPECIES: metal-sensitive transcriptional regulator [Clostridium]|uniref:Metal-sensitive transcriptional regulator n=1 Tax=Clostridium cibarium TaxID=2762247 RepID=A0ABR8PPS4_9CLOT|nr:MULTISPECIES: metal-sensitive transcriptional regulator [Clostridium]MBD7910170.1 metal-sensitive transcriptional regulator [Clostridium cibarium]
MDEADKNKDILNRLKRIEGQVKGIQKMVENDICCKDVLVQISAIRSAINKVGSIMIENYACNCLSTEDNKENEEELKELMKTINTFIK